MNNKFLLTLLVVQSSLVTAGGNEKFYSFSKAKKVLERQVYHDHRETIYCGATFDEKKNIIPSDGFTSKKHLKRAKKVEWEHVVPAENFGRSFVEWREGHEECVTTKGKPFKGRRCAEKTNAKFRFMQSDLYNLYPAVGAVNAMRSNYNFVASIEGPSNFGSCDMKIDNNKVEPPVSSRGRIARTYLYMQDTYGRYKMGKPQAKLMAAWDKMYPVSEWECKRAERIVAIQGNTNTILQNRCSVIKDDDLNEETRMLVMTRRVGETLIIGDDVTVTVLGVKGNQVRLGTKAPDNVEVHREETFRRIKNKSKLNSSLSNEESVELDTP